MPGATIVRFGGTATPGGGLRKHTKKCITCLSGNSRQTLSGIENGAEEMSNERFDSIWDAIEETPAQAENMKLRSALMMALHEHFAQNKMSQLQIAKLLGVTQPRVSDLMRGKIDIFGLDTLVNMAASAGLQLELRVSEAA
jgi:predicted XRE-type DNA-binding protein